MEGMHNSWSRAVGGRQITMRRGRWEASPVEYAARLWEVIMVTAAYLGGGYLGSS
ncbi:hypothetical protein Pint_33153 [Pistacia integerrima]|uniref:Uncharacterized protein n=1 Tax=Pistacia integerrima TaxID=434235 RepID=A0ACC0X5K6_9ROSI|nr:hypothetical protein Pint_33153 [Pistacia integerrima]